MNLDPLLSALASDRQAGIGVGKWSICAAETRRFTLGTRDRETGCPHAPLGISESCGARYLLVWKDGLVSRGDLERIHIEQHPLEALEQARTGAYDDPDAAYVLGPAAFPEVALHDPTVARMASGEPGMLVERLARVRDEVKRHGFRTWSGSFHATETRSRVISSAGLDATSAATSAGWYVTLDGETGTGFTARTPETAAEFDARLRRIADLAARLREAAPAFPPGTRTVILRPDVVESFVLESLIGNLEGPAVAHGESHFRREEFGSGVPVLREDLTLRIDPLLPLRSGSYRFTDEGVPAASRVFVDRGRLTTPVLRLKYARRLGLAPTPIPRAFDSLFLEGPEPLRLSEALRVAAGGVLVLNVLGAHTLDPTSGDFSLSAPQALFVRDGDLGGRLRVTLSGNLFDILRGDDLRLVEFEGDHTPGLLFRCAVQVLGG